jgi:hypothetical protein
MVSEWEASSNHLIIPRAYPSVALAEPSPSPTPAPSFIAPVNLYAVGGMSAGSTVERTWEFATLNTDGSLSMFGPSGISTTDCASGTPKENCMSTGRWAGFADSVTGPPSVTSEHWIIAGTGAAGGSLIQEHAQVMANGSLAIWQSITSTGGGAFGNGSEALHGAIGFYSNDFIAIINGWDPLTGGGKISNQEQFGTEACMTAASICPANTDCVQTAKSASTLNISPPVAWSGYSIFSGYLWVVGGSTDGKNAVVTVWQGAQ